MIRNRVFAAPPFLTARCVVAFVFVLIAVVFAGAEQAAPSATQKPSQAPQTAPQVARTLPSYEGQNVTEMYP